MNQLLILAISLFFFSGCQDSSDIVTSPTSNPNQPSDWLIPSNLVFDGGPAGFHLYQKWSGTEWAHWKMTILLYL